MDVLFDRFSADYLANRLRAQIDLVARLFGDGVGGLHLENIDAIFPLIEFGLRASGLWERGLHNAFDQRVVELSLPIARLPRDFDGLRLLHLSDLHLDIDQRHLRGQAFGEHLARLIAPLRFDLALLTGDHRFDVSGPYDGVTEQLAELMPALDCEFGAYAILGNHDFIEMVPPLEQLGLRCLLNESVALARGDARLWLVGLDDPHFYGLHDLDAALTGVPRDACVVLMVHSPEIGELAATRGASLYLCGHTHGGQLCFPGGLAPYVNARCPRSRVRGAWRVDQMQGYTSAGTGSSGLPVRFNRPPEIALLTLRRAAP